MKVPKPFTSKYWAPPMCVLVKPSSLFTFHLSPSTFLLSPSPSPFTCHLSPLTSTFHLSPSHFTLTFHLSPFTFTFHLHIQLYLSLSPFTFHFHLSLSLFTFHLHLTLFTLNQVWRATAARVQPCTAPFSLGDRRAWEFCLVRSLIPSATLSPFTVVVFVCEK